MTLTCSFAASHSRGVSNSAITRPSIWPPMRTRRMRKVFMVSPCRTPSTGIAGRARRFGALGRWQRCGTR
ncbi:hypothetical protein RSEGYP2_29 [Ralstonia phage RsoP1EGY]|uniref:Uncharacterized protein n=1 Tax=Ralstonia phage RsoP1EGY TaxID=2070026 RepID=A0A2R2ZGD0_9CAUD|nr:hypothetical protein HOT00_gp29 [Ralstonia phage RsoP1EGY]AUO78189.1 hypothetical protein RSEGYP2_29 [Ralstonia phage RsoP1EGY]